MPVRLEREAARIVFGWMQQPLPRVAPFAPTAELFAALGVAGSALPVLEYDLGPHHVFVVLESAEAVSAVRPDLNRLAAIADIGVNVVAGTDLEWHSRMFAPAHGVPEDPATGSAAGPLALHLASHGRIAFGSTLHIRQGLELARPSDLYAVAHGTASAVEQIEVGGAAVICGRGELRVA